MVKLADIRKQRNLAATGSVASLAPTSIVSGSSND
jgi:hypothetical protein